MSKTISIELLDHKRQPATTLCFLNKIGPLPDGSFICLTSLDKNVEYDDDTDTSGSRTYYAHTGIEISNLSSVNDLSVDNGEAKSLVPVYPGQGITVAQVDSGSLDGVEYVLYEVNYKDGTMGHEIMGGGLIGEVRIARGDLLTFEMRSWSQLLKQNSVCELDSLTCRVKKFGSQIGDERFPCEYDVSVEWIYDQVVTGVGTETVREFAASALAQADDYFAPGLVTWVLGDNAGTSQEIETFTTGGNIVLQFIARHPIQNGDTFNIRRDCSRLFNGHNSCETFWVDDRGLHFRGEPFIPVSDTVGLSIPFAAA